MPHSGLSPRIDPSPPPLLIFLSVKSRQPQTPNRSRRASAADCTSQIVPWRVGICDRSLAPSAAHCGGNVAEALVSRLLPASTSPALRVTPRGPLILGLKSE